MPKLSPKGSAPSSSGNGATVCNGAPDAPASVAALRESPEFAPAHRARLADELADALDALALPPPAFLAAMPRAGRSAPASGDVSADTSPADVLLNSDLWTDAAAVAAMLDRLGAFLADAGAVRLLAQIGGAPGRLLRSPRLGFRAGDTADDQAERAELCRRMNRTAPAVPTPGHARYECDLTGRAFDLPLGAPVPALLFDTSGTEQSGPFDLADRAPVAGEYVHAEPGAPSYFTVHPALVEAGPAHVLWAAWTHAESRLYDAVEALIDAADLAASLAGVEPDALGVEWPARAFRRWESVERAGEPRTWRRTLAGFSVPAPLA